MRLIDADKLIEEIKQEIDMRYMYSPKGFINVVNLQPTAYDVDKVISNIWDRSELIHIKHTHNDEIEDYIRTTDVSEIVRVGGIDD